MTTHTFHHVVFEHGRITAIPVTKNIYNAC